MRPTRRRSSRTQSSNASAPNCFLESDESKPVAQEKWSFDEIAVSSQQLLSFGDGHRGQLFLEIELTVVAARGVEQPAEFTVEMPEHRLDLGFTRRCFADREFVERNAIFLEPFDGFPAGAAVFVGVDLHRVWKQRGTARGCPSKFRIALNSAKIDQPTSTGLYPPFDLK
ncbi:MAG: hypothetical protein ACI8UO_004718 [Verrucomicrobiales bacterium]